jgi:hypothetical protein
MESYACRFGLVESSPKAAAMTPTTMSSQKNLIIELKTSDFLKIFTSAKYN